MQNRQSDLQLWAGAECTINRVGETWFDQHERSGHRSRVASDLEAFARLGLTTLRTGVHWEHFDATGSWSSFDTLLGEMRSRQLKPIAGLVHHGSGPGHTSLPDPLFPEKLAAYAGSVARRYPWITDYTPVNEPHTTARFSCLYGHWYPHGRDFRCYARGMVNQMRGVVLAMRAVREVQPEARLIHTEDGGAIASSPQLAAFREEHERRRWLGTDLLCGLITSDHPLFGFLLENGVEAEEILWFLDNPCPPSVLGLNYYVTSDRYLDHRTDLYPAHLAGGDSGTEPLVDIEAVRVCPEGIVGAGSVLTEAWERYRLPVAITEAHLGGPVDDQIRWLAEIWNEALAAQAEGVDVQAVTVWALLGSWDWCNLCTEARGLYEPGVFDVRSGAARPTALAEVVHQLATTGRIQHSALEAAGWWRQESRMWDLALAAD